MEAIEAKFELEDESGEGGNFKYPDRCSKHWNVEKQKHEYKQYLGAGQFCSPEIAGTQYGLAGGSVILKQH